MTEKLSITRALSEIKLLDKKIQKKISEFNPVVVTSGKKPPVGYESVDEFKKIKSGEYQSINDLIKRRSDIKRKLVLSNATTEVEINNTIMTIAEAIDYKTSVITFSESLINQITYVYNAAAKTYETNMLSIKAMLDRQLETLYGRDKKVAQDDIDTVTKPYLENNGPIMSQAINCEKEIKELREKVDNFLLEVDHKLSECNATTFIEI